MSQKGKGRKFFQHLQPTFAIDVPQATTMNLEFLDHSDPAKDIVVRKKAREWVNKNKAKSKQSDDGTKSQSASGKETNLGYVNRYTGETLLEDNHTWDIPISLGHFFRSTNLDSFDPFSLLPKVGRKYDHIIQFFLTSCPEEIPCSDDKYSDKSMHGLLPFSSDNTILGNMAKSKVTFILWLYATVVIRDGMGICINTEEVLYFYHAALKAIQETLEKDGITGEYSEDILKAIACITAAASFAGMFKTTELHRDALIRPLYIRGKGDVLAGLQSTTPWTLKALQWCEIMVATQLAELPQIPYYKHPQPIPTPELVISEAKRLTINSLANLPPLSAPLEEILHLFHYLGVAYAQTNPIPKIDLYILQPLYDVEYTILQVLGEQKVCNHRYSNVEVLLAETCQLYFWTGQRSLPPQTRLCDLLISRVMRALLPFLLEAIPEVDLKYTRETAASVLDNMASWVARSFHHPRTTSNAIMWSLALGTVVSAGPQKPEHSWFKEHFLNHLRLMGLDKNEQEYLDLLVIFPATDSFPWISLKTLYTQFVD